MDKDESKMTFTKEDVPKEEVEAIDEEKVTFNRTWCFWETYEPKVKSSQTDWSKLLKRVFRFKDVISFWQFWNIYPGSNFSEVFFNGEDLK